MQYLETRNQRYNVDGSKHPARIHQLIGSLSHYLQGFGPKIRRWFTGWGCSSWLKSPLFTTGMFLYIPAGFFYRGISEPSAVPWYTLGLLRKWKGFSEVMILVLKGRSRNSHPKVTAWYSVAINQWLQKILPAPSNGWWFSHPLRGCVPWHPLPSHPHPFKAPRKEGPGMYFYPAIAVDESTRKASVQLDMSFFVGVENVSVKAPDMEL